MSNDYDTLPVDALNVDGPEAERFRTSFGPPSKELVASIEAVGVLDPILVRSEGEGQCLVCGFRRVAAAGQVGLADVPVRVLPESVSVEQCLRFALGHNTAAGPVDVVEAARAVERWHSLLGWPDDRLRQELLPLMGMPPTEKHLSRLRTVQQLPRPAREALAAGRWDLSHVELIERFAADQWPALCETLLGQCRLTHSEALEVLKYASDICRRDGITVAELLQTDEDLSPRERGTELRRLLQLRRMPRLESQRARLAELLAELKLPHNVRLKTDRSFESRTVDLIVRLQDAGSWERTICALSRAGSPELRAALFACIRCEDPNHRDA